MKGFTVIYGAEDIVVSLDDTGVYTAGGFKGTCDEVAYSLGWKYLVDEADAYIQRKLQECVDMSWLTESMHKQLTSYPNVEVRLAVAEYSDKYHEILKDDWDCRVREAVAKYSDKYHEQFKDDLDWMVRKVVAEYSDKYHEHLKDDEDCYVRAAVANYKE